MRSDYAEPLNLGPDGMVHDQPARDMISAVAGSGGRNDNC